MSKKWHFPLSTIKSSNFFVAKTAVPSHFRFQGGIVLWLVGHKGAWMDAEGSGRAMKPDAIIRLQCRVVSTGRADG